MDELQLSVEASPEKLCGNYANASIVATTGAESRVDFLYIDHANADDEGVPAYLVSRVIMPTTELAHLAETLNDHIAKHLEQGM